MTDKLKIIKTEYESTSWLTSLGISPRGKPRQTYTGEIADVVGQETTLEDGTHVALIENGAIINGRIPMNISPRKRTGGCLINEYTSVKVEPDSL